MSAHTGFTPQTTDRTACFSVVAAADPGVMQRVLQVFAKRGLVPTQWYSTVCGPRSADLHIDVQVAGMDAGLQDRTAESLREVVSVGTVLTSEKRHALTA